MRSIRRLVLGSTLLLSACGGQAASDPASYTLAYNDLACRMELACAGTPAATCLALRDGLTYAYGRFSGVPLPVVEAAVANGGLVYHPAAAADCLHALEARGCNEGYLAACREVFTPQMALGAACGADLECVRGTCDRSGCGDDACCRGTCIEGSRGVPDIGEPCDYLRCDTPVAWCGEAGLCEPRIPVGEPCRWGGSCELGAWCSPVHGVCEPQPAEGDLCFAGGSGCLARDQWCNPATARCEPARGAGGDCSAHPSACLEHYPCDAESHTCIERPYGLGIPCDGYCPNPEAKCSAEGVCVPRDQPVCAPL